MPARASKSTAANLFGMGKKKTTHAPGLIREAYKQGYRGVNGERGDDLFEKWLKRQRGFETFDSKLVARMRAEYHKGERDEEEQKHRAGLRREAEGKKAAKPKFTSAGEYKGYAIRKTEEGEFVVPRIDDSWRHDTKQDAIETIKQHLTRGNMAKSNPTIYEALRRKLGRTPTNAELKADVERIKREAVQELAKRGKLPHQRRNAAYIPISVGMPPGFATRLMKAFHAEGVDAIVKDGEGRREGKSDVLVSKSQEAKANKLYSKLAHQVRKEFGGKNPDQITARKWYDFGYTAGGQEKSAADVGLARQDANARFNFIWERAIGNGEARAKDKAKSSDAFMRGYRDGFTASRKRRNPDAKDDPQYQRLYAAARAADEDFSAALVKEYGARRAGDMRYQSDKFPPHLKTLRRRKIEADERLHEKLNEIRRRQNLDPISMALLDQTFTGRGSVAGSLMKKLQKRNPEGAAAKAFTEFTGREPDQILRFEQSVHVHEWVWSAGGLVSLEVINIHGDKRVTLNAPDPAKAKIDDIVQLCFNEAGTQAYFVGGDQTIPIEVLRSKFGMNSDDVREKMLIGTVVKTTYYQRKSFEANGTEDINFWHEHGEEHAEGICPALVYHPAIGGAPAWMELVGGRYKIAPPAKFLKGVSPGIVG
jgi:hypothetical protein